MILGYSILVSRGLLGTTGVPFKTSPQAKLTGLFSNPEPLVLFTLGSISFFLLPRFTSSIQNALPWLCGLLTLIISLGVWQQTDRNLKWIGSDVAHTNYNAALLYLETGTVDLTSTWNARANPHVQPNYMKNSHEVLDRINSLGINWATGSR